MPGPTSWTTSDELPHCQAGCLWANDVPRRIGGVVVTSAAELPPEQPALVLHDGTDEGLALPGQVRGSGRRAVDLGLPAGRGELARAHPSTVIGWLEIAARNQERRRAGERRAAEIDFLAWPNHPV